MTRFKQTQSLFAAAIRDPDQLAPASLGGSNPDALLRRFNVYRNNVYAGLIGALEARFPAVQRLVGEEFFKAMARCFIEKAPPRSPALLNYGGSFPEFLRTFEPVSDEPYLPDVAELEWTMHVARHAADQTPLRASDVAAFGERGADMRIQLAPAVSLITSAFPVFSLWRANVGPEPASTRTAFSGAESILITRPALAVEAVRIPRGCAVFIAALLEDETLGNAAAAALDIAPDFPLHRTLALLISQKAIVSMVADNDQLQERPS